MLPQRRMRRMPDTFPTEDAAARLDLGPLGIECVAMVTEPFGTELPAAATDAALHQKPIVAQSLPIRRGQTIGLGYRNWQTRGKIGRTCTAAHSVASDPSRRLLTGVTIGPPMTMATSLRLTWLVDVPRTCRTASST